MPQATLVRESGPITLPRELWGPFLRATTSYCRGAVVVLPHERPERIYLVSEGRIRLAINNADGDEKTIRFVGPGGTFGVLSLFLPGPFGMTAVAAGPVSLGSLPHEEALGLFARCNEFAAFCARDLAWKLWTSSRQMADLAFESQLGKVANALLLLARESGEHLPDGGYALEITHQELAAYVSASRSNVSRALADLERMGLVRCAFRRILVPDLQLLRRRLAV